MRALVELKALLVQSPVEIGQQVGNLSEVILQSHGQVSAVRLIGQPNVVSQLILVGQRKAGMVLIAVYIVGLDAVATLLHRQIEPSPQDGAKDVELADVQPSLAGPTSKGIADDRGRKFVGVRTPSLSVLGLSVSPFKGLWQRSAQVEAKQRVQGSILVPKTCKNFASQSGWAGHAGALTRFPST